MSKLLFLAGLVVARAWRAGRRRYSRSASCFRSRGEIRFHNPNGVAVPFVYYSITSITNHVGALNPTNPQWHSITRFL